MLLAFAAALFGWSFLAEGEEGEGEVLSFFVETQNRAELSEALFQAGLIESPVLMSLYMRTLVFHGEPKRRSHLLRKGLSPRQLCQRLFEVGSREVVKVTLVEGWDYRAIAKVLEQAEVSDGRAFEAVSTDPSILDRLGIEGPSAEGYLFPATYEFFVDSDPVLILERLVFEFRKRLARVKKQGAPHPDLERLGFGDREILTLASIIEKETAQADEAPRVARVFLNRLLSPDSETKGRLQSDPTAAYGCRNDPGGAPSCFAYFGRITPEMLRDVANPYNTYRHAGLPPGPICNPGERALSAVLHPTEGEELYFVADGGGGHTFSLTYEEHQQRVEELKRLRGVTAR